MIKYLIGNARNAKSNDERRDIILALEEIALNAILKGYISTAEKIILSYDQLLVIYSSMQSELNSSEQICNLTDHPLRLLPKSLERVVINLSRNNLDELIHLTAHSLREFAHFIGKLAEAEKESSFQSHFSCIVSLESTVDRIISICLEKGYQSAGYNFIANFLAVIYEDKRTLEIVANCLKNVIIISVHHPNGHSLIARALTGLLYIAKTKKIRLHNVSTTILQELRTNTVVLNKTGLYQESTIGEQLSALKKLTIHT